MKSSWWPNSHTREGERLNPPWLALWLHRSDAECPSGDLGCSGLWLCGQVWETAQCLAATGGQRVRWSPLPSTFWGQSLELGLEVPRPRQRAMQQGRGRKGQSCRAQAKEGMSGGGSPQEGAPGESCLGKGAVAPQQQAAVPLQE